jgi:VanZ family protein
MSAQIKIIAVIYVFILAGIIFLADTRGTNSFAFINYFLFGDKIGHFCLMGTFSLLVNLVLGAKNFRLWKLNYLLGSLIVLTIVTAEEFSQMFIRGRTFDLGDLTFDYAGIFIFGEAARFICRKIITRGNFYQKAP